MQKVPLSLLRPEIVDSVLSVCLRYRVLVFRRPRSVVLCLRYLGKFSHRLWTASWMGTSVWLTLTRLPRLPRSTCSASKYTKLRQTSVHFSLLWMILLPPRTRNLQLHGKAISCPGLPSIMCRPATELHAVGYLIKSHRVVKTTLT